jgi:hypothetical protein
MTSVALKRYMAKHNDAGQKSVQMLTPFSMRQLPKTIEEHKLNNDITTLLFTLPLCNDYAEASKKIMMQTRKLKKSFYPYGARTLG